MDRLCLMVLCCLVVLGIACLIDEARIEWFWSSIQGFSDFGGIILFPQMKRMPDFLGPPRFILY